MTTLLKYIPYVGNYCLYSQKDPHRAFTYRQIIDFFLKDILSLYKHYVTLFLFSEQLISVNTSNRFLYDYARQRRALSLQHTFLQYLIQSSKKYIYGGGSLLKCKKTKQNTSTVGFIVCCCFKFIESNYLKRTNFVFD